MSTLQNFAYRTPAMPDKTTALFTKGSVMTVFGQVERIDHGWAGRLRFGVRLSAGVVTVIGNRDTLPLAAEKATWLRLKLRRPHGEPGDEPVFHVLSASIEKPDVPVAWLPTALHHRTAHMRRLRVLLANLDPVLQLAFMLTLADARLQRGFFWRVAAADHHVYPGGLFDQSVLAAELAYAQTYVREQDRGVATLAALLFDLGKVDAPTLAPDRRRMNLTVPHPQTGPRVLRSLATLERLNPNAIGELRALLTADAGTPLPAPTARIATQVHSALRSAWFEEQTDAR